ncbi:hypothetical protein Arno162_31 [Pectobacterium phage Arno162]|jgi:hypothetical protein|uniref:Uncharacterized protein n=2 Tax=Arnovirus TaxID=3425109 RepID=A0A678ZZG4_9CAUD|nr:hypothetical protein Arno162_31 [Pectobacterium phage Arno162]AZV02216.1 hypothetical protein Arno18_30 [Pectobacterium phage Arno18]
MFALIIALSFNPITNSANWVVLKDGFTSDQQCMDYAETHQDELRKAGALTYNCDTLKGAR